MKIKLLLITLLLIGCSSTPKKDYRVNDLNQASLDFINLADRKRQQESYRDAIQLYLQAESLGLRGNNQKIVNISKLKRALINLVQGKLQSAQTLINEVETANQIEELGLGHSISFVNSKLLLAGGHKKEAFLLLSSLEQHYQSNIEKKSYYQLVRWSHDYEQIHPASIQKTIDSLTNRFDDGILDNIEILSFAYIEHARWAADNSGLEQGEPIIQQSIDHFSLLELSSKIATSLKFASDFYDRHDRPKQSAYYLKAYQNLITVKQINISEKP